MAGKIIVSVVMALVQTIVAIYCGNQYKCIKIPGDKLVSLQNVFIAAEFCIACGVDFLLLYKEIYSPVEIINFYVPFLILQTLVLIDLKIQIIPNRLLIIGGIIKVLLLIWELIFSKETIFLSFIRSVAGLLICLIGMLAICFISKHGIGYGDVKLFAYLGFVLGPLDTYYILFYAVLLAAVYAVYAVLVKKEKRTTKISFGPFTYLGFVVVYLSTFIKG